MMCYLNLMNFGTEQSESKWQGVIKQNRKQFKSPEKSKGKEKQEWRENPQLTVPVLEGDEKHWTACSSEHEAVQ